MCTAKYYIFDLQTPFNYNKCVAMTSSEIIREQRTRRQEMLEKRGKANEVADEKILLHTPHIKQVSLCYQMKQ